MKCERTRSTRTAERQRGGESGRGGADRRQENNKVKMVTLTCTWAAKEEVEAEEAEEDEPEEENCDRRLSGREAHRENIRYYSI